MPSPTIVGFIVSYTVGRLYSHMVLIVRGLHSNMIFHVTSPRRCRIARLVGPPITRHEIDTRAAAWTLTGETHHFLLEVREMQNLTSRLIKTLRYAAATAVAAVLLWYAVNDATRAARILTSEPGTYDGTDKLSAKGAAIWAVALVMLSVGLFLKVAGVQKMQNLSVRLIIGGLIAFVSTYAGLMLASARY